MVYYFLISTGIDWNGNGKYDSVDIGSDIAQQNLEAKDCDIEDKGKSNAACLFSVFLLIVSFPFYFLRILWSGGLHG